MIHLKKDKAIGFFNEFKAFALRGNVIDLAVAVVIGTSFNKIIASLVDGIVMPLIGLIIGGIHIAGLTFKVGNAVVEWGLFLQNVLDFTLVALSIFVVINLLNKLHRKEDKKKPDSDEVKLLTEIRDLLSNSNNVNQN